MIRLMILNYIIDQIDILTVFLFLANDFTFFIAFNNHTKSY
jgi:hypothetical protein